MESSKYHRLIIDGNNFMYRAYHTQGQPVYVNGINTVPIYRFLSMLKSIVDKFRPDEIMLTWDKRLSSGGNFRKELVPYKEQRSDQESHTIIHNYIAHIQPITDALGIQTIYPNLFEADDVISFLTKMDDHTNIIISSDKDLLQLVDDRTHVFLPSKKITITPDNFEEVVGIHSKAFVLYKCILGDVSDNIPGLEKYGPVRAKRLAELIYNSGNTVYDILVYPTSSFNETKYNLSVEQVQILQRNIALMDLHYVHDELLIERESFTQQLQAESPSFSADRFRAFCYTFSLFTFIREIGTWTRLFDKHNKSANKDLLSTMSM